MLLNVFLSTFLAYINIGFVIILTLCVFNTIKIIFKLRLAIDKKY